MKLFRMHGPIQDSFMQEPNNFKYGILVCVVPLYLLNKRTELA